VLLFMPLQEKEGPWDGTNNVYDDNDEDELIED
jgi:hypothetical protein